MPCPTGTWVALPVTVVNGARPGKHIWLSAGIHGDELNGVEIIRRVLARLDPKNLAGAVIAVPIVNVFGFIHQSRELPDGRDLNRCFPGSPRGSLASRLAHLFMNEIVSQCQYGIDLHTGSNHRANLPQIRADLADPETRRCANAFAPSVLLQSRLRDGSLREAAVRRGIHVLLYEAGEQLRFHRPAIEVGVHGTERVLSYLGIASESSPPLASLPIREASDGRWVRASCSGILHLETELGQNVVKGQLLGKIRDAFGDRAARVKAPISGLVIGLVTNPLVRQGDALIHVALVK